MGQPARRNAPHSSLAVLRRSLKTYLFTQCFTNNVLETAFSALTLLIGRREEHTVSKNEWWGAGVVICLEQAQIICIWSSWCHCHPVISCFIKIQSGLIFLVPAYPDCPGKEAVKRVSVCLGDPLVVTFCVVPLKGLFRLRHSKYWLLYVRPTLQYKIYLAVLI